MNDTTYRTYDIDVLWTHHEKSQLERRGGKKFSYFASRKHQATYLHYRGKELRKMIFLGQK
jgi:hypothetical protein